jgi:hypothetical protein
VNEPPRRALAETLRDIDSLLGEGQNRDDVIDLEQLARDSGEPSHVIEMLLNGQEPPPEEVTDRIVRRFKHLRDTRRRTDGSRYSYEEIAVSFGATRARLSNLVTSWEKNQGHTGRAGGPLAATQAGIEKWFFDEPNGWLAADPATTLNRALQPVRERLLAEAGEAPYSGRRAVALRSAASLPDDQWKLVQGVIEGLVREVRKEQQQNQ